ncbi:MAG TPA: hypothetical protein VL793_00630, partial [Patescibacteria group bacterium]|nr:hypothetical protein [Patescibacteria group bacterium]
MKTMLSSPSLACRIGAAFLASSLALQAQSAGSGPDISISKTLPPDAKPHPPAANLVDQSQALADKKSRGCLECHAGVEAMHTSSYVVLG